MQVVFFATPSRREPVREYVASLPVSERAGVEAAILALEAFGLDAPLVDLRKIEGKPWEIRTASQRVFYVVIAGPAMVLLHAYKKQGQKAPLKELELARKRLKEVLSQ